MIDPDRAQEDKDLDYVERHLQFWKDDPVAVHMARFQRLIRILKKRNAQLDQALIADLLEQTKINNGC